MLCKLSVVFLLIAGGFATAARATANFVYHEQTANYVATPTCFPVSGGTDTAGGRFVENADRSPAAGFQIYPTDAYTLRTKVEYQFFTNEVRVYYTTDGSNPTGSFGTPFGTTQVAAAVYTYTYSDQTQFCQIVDITTATIPAQPAGTTVKYIYGAWHSGGGPEVFANSGTCPGCFTCTDSTTGCATAGEYSVVAPPTAAVGTISGRVTTPNGAGLSRIQVTISGGNLTTPLSVLSSSFGYYQFSNLPVGENYVLTVAGRKYTFEPPTRVVNLFDNTADADFIAR